MLTCTVDDVITTFTTQACNLETWRETNDAEPGARSVRQPHRGRRRASGCSAVVGSARVGEMLFLPQYNNLGHFLSPTKLADGYCWGSIISMPLLLYL